MVNGRNEKGQFEAGSETVRELARKAGRSNKKPKGFALLTPEQLRIISANGGRKRAAKYEKHAR